MGILEDAAEDSLRQKDRATERKAFANALQTIKELSERDSYAWLIEAPGIRYLRVQSLSASDTFDWTVEHEKALRFHSKTQADAVMRAVRALAPHLFAFERNLGDAKPVEHAWINS